MNQLTDSNLDYMFDSNNRPVLSSSNGVGVLIPSDVEAYLRSTGVNTKEQIAHISYVYNELNNYSDYINFANFKRLWLMPLKTSDSQLVDLVGLGSLIPTGDNSITENGISGDGTETFSTGIIPNIEISDVDNWSMGITSVTDDNAGTDIGGGDGANEHYIKLRSGGNIEVRNGSSSMSTVQDIGNIHGVMSSQGGTLKTYVDGVEVGTSTAVVGGLAALQGITIGGMNDNGTDSDHSSKRFNTAWIYDGQLSDYGIGLIHSILKTWTYKQR